MITEKIAFLSFPARKSTRTITVRLRPPLLQITVRPPLVAPSVGTSWNPVWGQTRGFTELVTAPLFRPRRRYLLVILRYLASVFLSVVLLSPHPRMDSIIPAFNLLGRPQLRHGRHGLPPAARETGISRVSLLQGLVSTVLTF